MKGPFSPPIGDLKAIQNALHGWKKVGGLGPVYFACLAVVQALFLFLTTGVPLSQEIRNALAAGRARVVNFFNLIDTQTFNPKPASSFLPEVDVFLQQLRDQVRIWRKAFKSLDMSRAEGEFFFKVVAITAPVLFNMGFYDAIPHSAQVSRLTASMAYGLGARDSEVLMALIVGWLHDPKLHPSIDMEKENLATHPINASALAYALMEDSEIWTALLKLLRGNEGKRKCFAVGLVDALGINNDSRFVNMMVILPAFAKRFANVYGLTVADQLKVVIEGRLESASRETTPPKLPDHLHGALSQMKLDSGLRGLSGHGWCAALVLAGIQSEDATHLFDQLIDGKPVGLSSEQLSQLKVALTKSVPNAVLRADVNAASLLHHHQEVIPSGAIAAAALVIADPMMLSAHKVLPVYKTAILHRLGEFLSSFEDNIRLLPAVAQIYGKRWQRAVYLAIVRAIDLLTGSQFINGFKETHASTSIQEDLNDLRAIILRAESWGGFAQASGTETANQEVKQVIDTLKATYESLVNEYREAVYKAADLQELDKFYPVS